MVSSEDLIKYAHRISSSNAVEAPVSWMPGLFLKIKCSFSFSGPFHTTKCSFIYAVRPTGHTNPSIHHKKQTFQKLSPDPRNMKIPALHFSVDGKHFESRAFQNQCHEHNHVTCQSFAQKQDNPKWPVIVALFKFLRCFTDVNHLMHFQSENAVFKFLWHSIYVYPGPRGFLLFFIGKFCDANRFLNFFYWHEVLRAEKRKPLVVTVGNLIFMPSVLTVDSDWRTFLIALWVIWLDGLNIFGDGSGYVHLYGYGWRTFALSTDSLTREG